MNILVEASTLDNNHKSGVYYFNYNLLLAAQKKRPDIYYYFVFVGGKKPVLPKGLKGEVVWIKQLPNKLWRSMHMFGLAPDIARIRKLPNVDAVFNPAFLTLQYDSKTPTLSLIHDTAFLDTPQFFPARFAKYLHRITAQSCRKANQLLVNSDYTAKSLVRHFGVDRRKISVINPAVDHEKFFPRPSTEVAEVKHKYGITKDYILFLGTLEPRKNISRLIKAYLALPQAQRDRYQLVLAGGKGWLDEGISNEIARAPEGAIVTTGYIDAADSPALYSGATVFVFPSIFEGWGMPIAEAMACGVPVITANNSSLPEVGGKAADYVSAHSTQQLTHAMAELLDDKKRRQHMSNSGLLQSKKFRWDKAGDELVAIFEELHDSD